MENIVFTSENLIDNIDKLGAWSSYYLASIALIHYFPNEYDEERSIPIEREIELVGLLGCEYWRDVVIFYQKEVGYNCPEGFNPDYVNKW